MWRQKRTPGGPYEDGLRVAEIESTNQSHRTQCKCSAEHMNQAFCFSSPGTYLLLSHARLSTGIRPHEEVMAFSVVVLSPQETGGGLS